MTQDTQRELSDEDLYQLWMGANDKDVRTLIHSYTRAVIAADRALNAPADLEHQSAGKPVAWLLTDKKINDIQVDSVQRLIDRARQAHFTDLIIRINGKDEHYQADWLKHLVRAEVPVCAPADRDVMRKALSHAQAWISSAPHGDNCFVSSHYDGDPGDGCNCGKDGALQSVEAALAVAPNADRDVMRQTLEYIANADQREWDEGQRDDRAFKEWAQSRARYALAASPTPPAEQPPAHQHALSGKREELIGVLRGGQQCDADGVLIAISRQACVEAANFIEGAPLEVDANNYCLILRELGMEEEGDPVAEVRRLKCLAEQPIDMVLHCSACGMQHIDTPEYWGGEVKVHRSHLCVPDAGGCGHIWRPADVPTNGVAAIKTKGKDDSAPAEQQGEKSEANPPLPTDLLYAANKRAVPSEAKLRCRKCGDSYEITFNHAVSQSEGVGQEGPAEQQGEPDYPVGEVAGACVCGGWPGGECLKCPKVEQEPIIYKRSEFTKNWTTFNVRREHADAAEARLKSSSLATLRAKVEALHVWGSHFDGNGNALALILKDTVLAEIDKMGGGAS